MSAKNQLDLLVHNFQKKRPLRAGSLIITLYGDAIVPRGGSVWLGSLMKLLEPMGISERLVRTSIFRLTKESWVQAGKVGRRSYYSLTGPGLRRFEQAFKQVYTANNEQWIGNWCLVFLSQLENTKRRTIKEELEWMGFGCLAPNVMAHPRLERAEVLPLLQEHEALEDTIVMQTEPLELLTSRALRLQVKESWNLEHLASSYAKFINQFRPLWQELTIENTLTPEESLITRTLLIHEYRKVLLRDPQLPDELLPGDWEGRSARQLCRNLYRLIYESAEQWLDDNLENSSGPLPAPNANFYQRFGGLK
ncbi:MAG TPA: phenylacetic acid degradation operon negative regulatory protein PaaX [Marinospirillum sp.]|uniref:phenylacetic acid degradation operon negative regulatory protein PaaX n=1 Tax=Marinospirillum sp. TaxID=2183934 RepID=UPI002B4AAB48|nr:phenylacetic acid degradation operon negative regulatory protein PaaX [Marinospirillum sp.]HKM15261.1 phenylacetic acid degradation operon negative regulatory protein PaaX [Marinospirillum sp.]